MKINSLKTKVLKGFVAFMCVISCMGCNLIADESGKSKTDDPLLDVYDNTNNKETEGSDDVLRDLDTSTLEDGCFYIMHKNNQCDPVYLGETTFTGTTETPANNRIIWFKDDIENIPTLSVANEDKLIFYSTVSFDETFNLERFEDYGYSVGLQGIQVSKTGRLFISTDVGDKTTYPNSDTDEILNMDNETVVIEKLGKNKLRETEFLEDKETLRNINRSGVLIFPDNKNNNNYYQFEVYDGTIHHDVKLKCDVRVMGSYEVKKNTDYEYSRKDIVRIVIPETFQSGYYMINGMGVFRYIDMLDSNTMEDDIDFNIPNAEDEEGISTLKSTNAERLNVDINSTNSDSAAEDTTSKNNIPDDTNIIGQNSSSSTDSENKSSFTITNEGSIKVVIYFQNDQEGMPLVKGTLIYPDGTKCLMKNEPDGSLSIDLDFVPKGEYTITYKNLNGRIPRVSVT